MLSVRKTPVLSPQMAARGSLGLYMPRISNFVKPTCNGYKKTIEDVARWFDYYEMRPGTGERVNAGGVNIVFSDSNTHHRGSQNYRTSGEVDALRLPKDGWYAHQVMWDNWVDIEKPAIHIIGHWNYNDTTVKNVSVVSTADRVELKLNGRSLGFGEQSHRFLYTFANVTWEAGELEAIGYAADGKNAITSDKKITAGEPAGIRLTPHHSPDGFHANGADIALVDVEVIDSKGRRNPIALNKIDFTLSGEATWRGGIAVGPDNYILSTSLPVENGINRVLLRSTTKAGEVTLKAESEGLKSTAITLHTVPFHSKDGLAEEIPGDNLGSNLSRGPTPRGESYTTKRKAMTISSASAGSNPSETELTYDDNEYSTWESSSSAGSAWISYALENSANITQVVMKMDGFRTRSYALQVSVGGKVVWTGSTAKTLGYVTLDLDPAVGSNVTIALDGKGKSLCIIKAEVYTPPGGK